MKPEMTEWLRKFARKPSLSTPIRMRTRPDSAASTTAAVMPSASPAAVTGAMADAVISETTATGPTANVRDDPKMA